MRRIHVLPMALAAAMAWSGLDARPMYRIVRIPGLGGRDTRAQAINDRGMVVGTATLEGDSETRGFFFDGSATTPLPGLTPEEASIANGLNEKGDIVGQSIDVVGLRKAAVLWRWDGPIDLNAACGWDGGIAIGINDAGVVVGIASVGVSLGKGFVWDAEGGCHIVELREGDGSANRAINDAGFVVGDTYFAGSVGKAHLAIPGEQGYEVRAIGVPTAASGAAWAINDKGLIVGMAARLFKPFTAAIFTPDAEKPLVDLGTLPGASESAAFGVNDEGDIVGTSGNHPDWIYGHAFVVVDGTMHDLNELIDDGEGEWDVLIEASDINNRREIVGWGYTRDGQVSAFLLQPEHPDFIRGDSNVDSAIDISDALKILFNRFMGDSMPCEQAGDANDDGALDISDAISVLSFLFLGEKAIEPPVGACGVDPSGHTLPCEIFPGCP